MANNYPEVENLRKELLESEVLSDTGEGIVFTQDYLFTSTKSTALSTTASLILHGSQNGKEKWRTEDGNPIYMLINNQ